MRRVPIKATQLLHLYRSSFQQLFREALFETYVQILQHEGSPGGLFQNFAIACLAYDSQFSIQMRVPDSIYFVST